MAKKGGKNSGEISTKITMEGVQQYKDSIKAIEDNLSLLRSKVKLLDATYGENAKKANALTEKKKLLAQMLQENKNKMEAANRALEAQRAKYGENSKEVIRAERSLNYHRTAVINSENELKELSKELNKARFGFESLGDFAKKSALSLGKIGLGVAKFGLRATTNGVKTLAASASTTAVALVAMTVAAGAMADDLLTQSSITRLSTEELQKYQYALNFIDGDMGALTGSMQKNIKSMSAAKSGSRETRNAYKQLGVSFKDSSGQLRNSNEVYWEVIDALKNVENETERDALAMKLLGKSATELNPVIEAGSEAFQKMGDEALSMGLVLGEDSLNKLGKFDDTVQRLKATGSALRTTFALIALPFLQQIGDEGQEVLGRFNKAMRDADGDAGKMREAISALIKDLATLVSEHMPTVIGVGGEVLGALLQGLVDNADKIGESITKVITSLSDELGKEDRIQKLFKAGGDILTALIKGLAENSKQIAAGVGSFLLTLGTLLVEQGGKILGDLLIGLIAGIFQEDFDDVVARIEQFKTNVREKFESVVQAIKDIFRGMKDSVVGFFRSIGEAIDNVIKKLNEFLGLTPKDGDPNRWKELKGGFFGNYKSPIGHAEGGVFTKPTFFPTINSVVGEAGAEVVLPLRKLWNWMDERYQASAKPQYVIQVTQHIHAEETSYYGQQKRAGREMEALMNALGVVRA